MGFRVKSLGLRIGFRVRVQGSGFRVKDLGFGLKGLGFSIIGLRMKGSGVMV